MEFWVDDAGCEVAWLHPADARRTGLPPESFNPVHARTLLVNLPEPAKMLAEMVRLAKPGGWVASLEPDVGYALCHPAHPAYTRMWELFRAAFSRNGADLLVGRRLAELWRQAGPHDVGTEALDRTVRSHLDDPRTLVMPHLSFLAWGRKPEAQQS